jgi:hypothetical protein
VRESGSVFVCVCVRERETIVRACGKECMCVSVCERERKRLCIESVEEILWKKRLLVCV